MFWHLFHKWSTLYNTYKYTKQLIYSETSHIRGPWEIIIRTADLENLADKIHRKVEQESAVYMPQVPKYRPVMIIWPILNCSPFKTTNDDGYLVLSYLFKTFLGNYTDIYVKFKRNFHFLNASAQNMYKAPIDFIRRHESMQSAISMPGVHGPARPWRGVYRGAAPP